eukprot:12130057-Heterocapsa_arctica.AAC.1
MQCGTANARWVCTTCRTCRTSRAQLIADVAIPLGAEITVARADHVAGTTGNEPATQVSFDGGAKDGASGAGAALWTRDQHCQWRLAATSSIALPGIGHPQ